ncbi:GntR family transcriptional regulator [Profundibacter sp.]
MVRAGNTPRRIASSPRYAVVAQALMDEILSGRYPVNTNLPTELALCKQFNISRHTAREALRQLQALGLVSRRAGVGTTVKSNRIAQRYMQVGDTVSDLFQYAQDVVLRVDGTSDIDANGPTAELLGCPQGQSWLKLHGLRVRGEDIFPISLTDVYIARAYRGVLADCEDNNNPIHSLIHKRYGVELTEVRQQITATILDNDEAEKLHSTTGAPALKITRHYFSEAGELFEIAINLYPADRFTYSNTLRIESASVAP